MLDRIISNEKSHTCLTSTETRINENLIRYDDDQLPDMYDNNYFSVKREITENDYATMLAYKERRGDKHLKVLCDLPSDILSAKKMETGILLTMLKTDHDYPDKCRKRLDFKCLKDEDIKEDLIQLEVKHYAQIYGMEFTLRKSNRLYDLAKDKGNNLYYFAAYHNDTIVASCSAYFSNDVVGFDDLITDRDYRHQGIATALMSYVHNYFACPMFLHADEDDTPKDMYRNFGYITVKKDYEYLISDYTN